MKERVLKNLQHSFLCNIGDLFGSLSELDLQI